MWSKFLRFFGLVTYKSYKRLLEDCAEIIALSVAAVAIQTEKLEKKEEKTSDSPVFAEERPKKRTSKSKKV